MEDGEEDWVAHASRVSVGAFAERVNGAGAAKGEIRDLLGRMR
jgi:hypothetical protein